MFKNYLTIALRSMAKAKVLAFINIIGLALGIACAILIIFFVKDEITFDSFHAKAERIYRPWTEAKMRGREMVNTATPFIMGKQLAENFEDVEKYTVWTQFNDIIEKDDKSFTENINVASPNFFEIFDFEVLDGSVANTLENPTDLVITREMAEKYFGDVYAAGETISILVGGDFKEFEVKAVLENVPSNSSLQFELLVSDYHLKDLFPEQMLTSWFMITGDNYVLLKEGVNPDELTPKFQSVVEQNLGERASQMEYNINLQPIQDMHLNTDLPEGNNAVNDPKYIYVISGIALLILVIACVNFMTLSLGRSLSRMKEIGVRKSIGAQRGQLMWQFMGEAILTSIFALIIGLILSYLFLDKFNELSGKSLLFDLSWPNILLFTLVALSAGIISGFYPAVVLSRFKPAVVLKGVSSVGGGKQRMRTMLVAGQFVLSIFLISCTLIMQKQFGFMQNKNLGFDKENVIIVPLNVSNARGVRDGITKGFEKANAILPALKGASEIISVGLSSHTFEPGNWTEVGWTDDEDNQYGFFYNTVNEEYIPTLDMKIVQGRNFSADNQADFRRSIIVNESFVKEYDLDNPIGDRIPSPNFIDHEIIGVVKDFHIESLHTEIQPLVLAINTEIGFSGAQSISIGSGATPKLSIRVKPNETQNALAAIEKIWNDTYAGEPFDYEFLDENLKEQYEREQNLGNVVTNASMIAIIVGCLGLFGLSALTLASRVREISIRKVFGATRNSLFITLSKSFAIMVVVAMLVAAPVSWYVMDDWLAQFQYKTNITPIVFLVAGFLSLVVAFISISYQCIKVTNTNPANSLRVN